MNVDSNSSKKEEAKEISKPKEAEAKKTSSSEVKNKDLVKDLKDEKVKISNK